jgi:hypothetical protein
LDFGLYNLDHIYSNPVQNLYGTPVVIFRDHRWTLPVIFLARQEGILKYPVKLVTFDRHPDLLLPVKGAGCLEAFRKGDNPEDLAALVKLVRDHLSPRDDDWIISGMELGLISDVIQFGAVSEMLEDKNNITCHKDGIGLEHRIFRLGLPSREFSYKGAFADPCHAAVIEGMWDIFDWSPEKGMIRTPKNSLITDIDLDFFTITWENYIFPFPEEVYMGEFFTPSQSSYSWSGLKPYNWMQDLIASSGLATVACEPDFCGGKEKSGQVLEDVNRFLFDSKLDTIKITIEQNAGYPSE